MSYPDFITIPNNVDNYDNFFVVMTHWSQYSRWCKFPKSKGNLVLTSLILFFIQFFLFKGPV